MRSPTLQKKTNKRYFAQQNGRINLGERYTPKNPWKRHNNYKSPIVGFHVSFGGCIQLQYKLSPENVLFTSSDKDSVSESHHFGWGHWATTLRNPPKHPDVRMIHSMLVTLRELKNCIWSENFYTTTETNHKHIYYIKCMMGIFTCLKTYVYTYIILYMCVNSYAAHSNAKKNLTKLLPDLSPISAPRPWSGETFLEEILSSKTHCFFWMVLVSFPLIDPYFCGGYETGLDSLTSNYEPKVLIFQGKNWAFNQTMTVFF